MLVEGFFLSAIEKGMFSSALRSEAKSDRFSCDAEQFPDALLEKKLEAISPPKFSTEK